MRAWCERSKPDLHVGLENAAPFSAQQLPEAKRLGLRPQINREMEDVVQHYLTYLLERGLNTPPFIRKLRMRNVWEIQAVPTKASVH